ncbi:MAG: hypothetical protein LBE12_12675 [Planctomycetaceae bacterium]|jgi:hypothetical protein|nr:hypothetical protein [Planctomycetaceae bacterium]
MHTTFIVFKLFFVTVFVCSINLLPVQKIAAQATISRDAPYVSDIPFLNSTVQDGGFERTLYIHISDSSVFKTATCAGDPGSHWGVFPGYAGTSQVEFNGTQNANIKADMYYPEFFGRAGWIGGSGNTNTDYRWHVDTNYMVICNEKCKSRHDVEVSINYDINSDPDDIDSLFSELLHKDCSCGQDHTIDWSQVNWGQEGIYNVICNHPDKCPLLGTVKVVDIDFEIKLVPNDRNFPTRSYSRLGLLESGHIETIPQGNTSVVDSEYSYNISDSDKEYLILTNSYGFTVHPNASWICDFNAQAVPGVAKIKVTQTRNGANKTKTYTVSIIEPNDVYFEKYSSEIKIGDAPPHLGVQGFLACYVLPNDVSFSNLKIGEYPTHAQKTGCCVKLPNYHQPNSNPLQLNSPVDNKGTPSLPNLDPIGVSVNESGAGSISFRIPWYFKTANRAKVFVTIT